MRCPIAVAAFTVLLVCGGRRAVGAQTRERFALDSGTSVRVRPDGRPAIEGYLLRSYGPGDDSLRMCAAAKGSRCVDGTAPAIHHFAARELEGVAIRGPQTFNLGLVGLYAGGLSAVALVPRPRTEERTAPGMVAGMLVGAVLGGLIGKHVEGWIPLFPCGAHGQCVWPPGANPHLRGVR